MRESSIDVTAGTGEVVWRMTPDLAERLAMLVSDHASRDAGWREDAESLFDAAERARTVTRLLLDLSR